MDLSIVHAVALSALISTPAMAAGQTEVCERHRLAPTPLPVWCVGPAQNAAAKEGPAPYDINDIGKPEFDAIIDTLFGLYREEFARVGKRAKVNKRWAKDHEGALSWLTEEYDRETEQIRQTLELEFMGGLARHPMLNRDAFALVVCHEIGHHLGGAPHALGYSAEGQADYFAAAKCMKRFLTVAKYRQPYREALPPDLERACRRAFDTAEDQAICRRNILAGLTLARWFAHVKGVAPPTLHARDPVVAEATLVHGYPPPQCRLDTFVAGALCTVDATLPFSSDDLRRGACSLGDGPGAGARPRCWFKGEEVG